jgi:hypothetical protein
VKTTPRRSALALRILAGVLVTLGSGAPGFALQKLRDRSKAVNDPVQCPYCFGDPALMEAAGILSHGGFEFARIDTAQVDSLMATSDIRWIETPHFELGFALATSKVNAKDRNKLRAELGRLAEVLPEVDPKSSRLDPWLGAHLYAQRAEDLWRRMLELLEVQESDFPDGKTLWHGEPPYLGEGPHLGQKGKYEILILPSAGASKSFLLDQFGLSLKTSVRYNVPDRDSLILVTHTRQGSLTRDAALHGHVVFNLTHNLIDGYKHYSYDTPIWLHEGLAHYLERELNPEYNSFDSGEGATAEKTSKSNWTLPTRKLVQRDDAPSMAQLMALRSYADLELEHHFSSWSRVEYLLQEHPGFLARLLAALKGRTDAAGLADGSGVADAQREVFRDELGMSYAQFDRAWADWVLSSD